MSTAAMGVEWDHGQWGQEAWWGPWASRGRVRGGVGGAGRAERAEQAEGAVRAMGGRAERAEQAEGAGMDWGPLKSAEKPCP